MKESFFQRKKTEQGFLKSLCPKIRVFFHRQTISASVSSFKAF